MRGTQDINIVGCVLPPSVQDWLGVNTSNPRVIDARFECDDRSLIGLNDSHGYTFDQIADVIENNLTIKQ